MAVDQSPHTIAHSLPRPKNGRPPLRTFSVRIAVRSADFDGNILVVCEIVRAADNVLIVLKLWRRMRRKVLDETYAPACVVEVVQQEIAEFGAGGGEEGEDGLPGSIVVVAILDEANVAEFDARQVRC